MRSAGLDGMATLHLFLGASLLKMLSDEKPALITVLEERIAKAAEKAPPAPTKFEAGAEPAAADEATSESAPAAAGQPGKRQKSKASNDLLPRSNLAEVVSSDLIAELDDTAWKVRAAALEQLGTILAKHPCVSAELGDLLPALQRRLGDSNKNLVITTLNHLVTLGEALGSAGKPVVTQIMSPTLANMADAKEQVRTASAKALDAFAEHLDLEVFVENSAFPEAMASGKPFGQAGAMAWLTARLSACEDNGDLPSLKKLVKPVFACIGDRAVEVRKAAQDLLSQVARGVGTDTLRKVAGTLPDSAKPAVLDAISKCVPQASKPSKAAASKPSSRASASDAVGSSTGDKAAASRRTAPAKEKRPSGASATSGTTGSAADATGLCLCLDSGKNARARDEKNHKV